MARQSSAVIRERALARAEEMWAFERKLAGTASAMAGVDEAGRGALAGPVVAAAVILRAEAEQWVFVDDSKTLSKAKRTQLSAYIYAHAHAVGVGVASVEEIDTMNILHASRLAMGRAVANLGVPTTLVLADGTFAPIYEGIEVPSIPVIDGDALCLSVAAASIVAKVHRDSLMEQYADKYPYYGFEQNAGYGTKLHLQGLEEHGPSEIHRQSFAPVQRYRQVRLDL